MLSPNRPLATIAKYTVLIHPSQVTVSFQNDNRVIPLSLLFVLSFGHDLSETWWSPWAAQGFLYPIHGLREPERIGALNMNQIHLRALLPCVCFSISMEVLLWDVRTGIDHELWPVDGYTHTGTKWAGTAWAIPTTIGTTLNAFDHHTSYKRTFPFSTLCTLFWGLSGIAIEMA